jgi:hypothetical protein
MSRRLLALNVVLVAASALLAIYIVRELAAPIPVPVASRRPAGPATTAASVEAPRPPAGAYTAVAARNLFSPTRTESATGPGVASAVPLVRPNLYGVVLRDGAPVAYLEDPATKRVAGYRVGDKIIGGTVQTIKADGVLITRPDGDVDVRLRDPSKPRSTTPVAAVPAPAQLALPGVIPPAAAPPPIQAQPQQPGQPVQAGQQAVPGMPPIIGGPPQGITLPQIPPQVGVQQPGQAQQPGVTQQQQQPVPGRRPLPPNLLRRLPPGMGDATQQ